MMRFCCPLGDRIQPCLRDYDRLQSFAVFLIYIQIACALVGSLGALYNGVLLINLAIALFALVAIESSSQQLGRTYAVLLLCAILLDIAWFVLFSYEIWHISTADYGAYYIFSVKLALAMQIVGFSVRLSSSFLWIQMYRLGVSHSDTSIPREADFDLRNSFLCPATPAIRQTAESDDVFGGSIYDPAYYSSLFEDGLDNGLSNRSRGSAGGEDVTLSAPQAPLMKLPYGKSFAASDIESQKSPSRTESAVSTPRNV